MPQYDITDPKGHRRLVLNEICVTLGRSRRCTVRLHDRSLSRRHCEISRREQGWWLKDLESRNRTFVNGLPVTELLLKPGDRIEAGQAVIIFEPGGDWTPGLAQTAEVRAPGEAADGSPGQAAARSSGAALPPGPSPGLLAAVTARLTPWRAAGIAVGGVVLLIAGLYAADEGFEIVVGSLRFRRGTTQELTRKVVAVTAAVILLHLLILGVGSLVRRKPTRKTGRGAGDRRPPGPPPPGRPYVERSPYGFTGHRPRHHGRGVWPYDPAPSHTTLNGYPSPTSPPANCSNSATVRR